MESASLHLCFAKWHSIIADSNLQGSEWGRDHCFSILQSTKVILEGSNQAAVCAQWSQQGQKTWEQVRPNATDGINSPWGWEEPRFQPSLPHIAIVSILMELVQVISIPEKNKLNNESAQVPRQDPIHTEISMKPDCPSNNTYHNQDHSLAHTTRKSLWVSQSSWKQIMGPDLDVFTHIWSNRLLFCFASHSEKIGGKKPILGWPQMKFFWQTGKKLISV